MRAHPWLWFGLWKDCACTHCMLGFRPARSIWAKGCYLGSLLTLVVFLLTFVGTVIFPDWNPSWVQTLWPLTYLAAIVLLMLTQLQPVIVRAYP